MSFQSYWPSSNNMLDCEPIYNENVATRIVLFEKYEPHKHIFWSGNNIQVGTKKINANWSVELAQDLQAYQCIDIEAQLTAILSEKIAEEIDNQILIELRDSVDDRSRLKRIVIFEKAPMLDNKTIIVPKTI